MSEPGDVVWADGQAWIRGTTAYGDHKAWWCHPLPVSGEVYRRLSEAEQADDFMWLVKDGIPIVLNALAVYQALDSFADFVAKRDADAELTAERDELRSRLADMTAQRDAARKDAQEAVAEHKKLVDHYAVDFPRRAADNKELRELRQTCSDLGKENEQLSAALNDEKRIGRQDERAAIVKWLNEDPQGWVRHWSLAGRLERGVHLGGDDESVLSFATTCEATMSEPTVSDPAWCRGYDAGYFIGLRVGAGRERAAIVAWLHKQEGMQTFGDLARAVERGEHLRGDDE